MTDVSTNKATEKEATREEMLEWLEDILGMLEEEPQDRDMLQAIRDLIQSASSASQPCGCKSAKPSKESEGDIDAIVDMLDFTLFPKQPFSRKSWVTIVEYVIKEARELKAKPSEVYQCAWCAREYPQTVARMDNKAEAKPDVIKMKPKREYKVKLKIDSYEKAKPRPSEREKLEKIRQEHIEHWGPPIRTKPKTVSREDVLKAVLEQGKLFGEDVRLDALIKWLKDLGIEVEDQK